MIRGLKFAVKSWGIGLGLGCVVAFSAAADELRLISPNEIDYREIEIEYQFATTLDSSPDKRDGRFYSLELGTGLTPWWHVGVEMDVERDVGQDMPTSVQGATLENIVRLTQPGENWADAALYSEYSRSSQRDVADDLLVGALFLKDIGRTSHILDLFFDKNFGGGEDDEGVRFSYSWQSRWNIYRQFAPAIEIFGNVGRLDRPDGVKFEPLIAGPVATGTFLLGPIGKLRYEAGYLFGMTEASPSGTIRVKAELEVPF